MTDKHKKDINERIATVLDKTDKVAEAVEQFTPPSIDKKIDEGVKMARFGASIFSFIKAMLPRKKKN